MKTETKNTELFRAEVSEPGEGYGSFILIALGMLVVIGAFALYSKSHSVIAALSVLFAGGGLLVYIAIRTKQERRFFVVESAGDKLAAGISGNAFFLGVNPAGRIDFFYDDQFSRNDYKVSFSLRRDDLHQDRFSNGKAPYSAVSSTTLYAVFYNEKSQPVFALTENVMTLLLHVPKNGFRELAGENRRVVENVPVFSGPVQKVREFCG